MEWISVAIFNFVKLHTIFLVNLVAILPDFRRDEKTQSSKTTIALISVGIVRGSIADVVANLTLKGGAYKGPKSLANRGAMFGCTKGHIRFLRSVITS